MSVRLYKVTLIAADGSERTVTVPSKTDIQAGDAAVKLAEPGESLGAIEETEDTEAGIDTLAAGTQSHPDWKV